MTKKPNRIVIAGGGFGGVYTAVDLERLLDTDDAEVILVSMNNYFLMTPLLFEVGSGVLEFRHAVNPIRPLIKKTHFINAIIERIDLDAKVVHAASVAGDKYKLDYDQLVLAMGQLTNTTRIPGSDQALTYRTIADAILFRNRVIEAFERADASSNEEQRRKDLTFVVVGGGLVGVELMGELTELVGRLLKLYRRIRPEMVRLILLHHGAALVPELAPKLGRYSHDQFKRRGVDVRVNTGAERIEPERVYLPSGETIDASVIVLAAGLAPNPIINELNLPKDHGRVITDACMRVPSRPEVWAIGDCAAIPGPEGKPYPTLAQHALREAKVLSKNLAGILKDQTPQPFVYHALGSMAALGHYRGIANLMGVNVKGFLAWVVWRTYYLFQMPRWERRMRILLDWTIALFFRPDTVKVDLAELPHNARLAPKLMLPEKKSE